MWYLVTATTILILNPAWVTSSARVVHWMFWYWIEEIEPSMCAQCAAWLRTWPIKLIILQDILTGHFWIWRFYSIQFLCNAFCSDAVMISVFFGVLSCFARKPFMKKNSAVISCHCAMKCNKVKQQQKELWSNVMMHVVLYLLLCCNQ